jgi:nicotinamidase/pyrazinamidase
MEIMPKISEKNYALLLVDVQRDFCSGGKLAVPGADEIVPLLNRWVKAAARKNIPIYASRDWHPRRHPSFREEGGPWPPHCLADSEGAAFHPDLQLPDSLVLITKGVRFDQDQNSVFDQTGFAAQLRRDAITSLWVGGLALDVCVRASVMDALLEGLQVALIQAATRPVNAAAGALALKEMQEAGAVILPDPEPPI